MPSVRSLLPRRRNSSARGARGQRGVRLRQLGEAFTLTRRHDKRLVPLLVLSALAPLVLLLLVGFAIGHPVYLAILGLLIGLVAASAVFGRRAQGAVYAQVEGQLGAGAAVLTNMRGNWRVTPAVRFTKEQDLLHRVVGRPGVVLVGEGQPARVRGLLAAEKKQLARTIGDTPLYDVLVGDGEGQVPLRRLERHLLKLPHNVKPAAVNDLERRLRAMRPAPPLPKGPVPTRVPRGRVR